MKQSATLINALLENPAARMATYYVDPKFTIKVTRRHKPNKRDRRVEFVVTLGEPNYLERDFIKKCKKAGEPFPVKKIQFKLYPKKS